MSCFNTLKEKGLRLTPQRRLIADVIHKTDGHVTAEYIIEHVQGKMPGVNKSTIYRTLELLEQAGCVFKSEADGGIIYHHAEEGHHHHLVCLKCGTTLDCEQELFLPVEESIAVDFGFKVEFQHMVIKGLCQSCQKSVSNFKV
jgi:Fur family transcriptional regulator, ferric uptake regulator